MITTTILEPHITVSPPQRTQIYGAVRTRIEELRIHSADASAGLLADILEEVVIQQRGEPDDAAAALGHRTSDALFIEQWNRAATELKSLVEAN